MQPCFASKKIREDKAKRFIRAEAVQIFTYACIYFVNFNVIIIFLTP
jgi:hypothetical protein